VGGSAEHLGGHAAEISHFDEIDQGLLFVGQSFHRQIEVQEIDAVGTRLGFEGGIQLEAGAIAMRGCARPGVQKRQILARGSIRESRIGRANSCGVIAW
jgi:hypothetical protein